MSDADSLRNFLEESPPPDRRRNNNLPLNIGNNDGDPHDTTVRRDRTRLIHRLELSTDGTSGITDPPSEKLDFVSSPQFTNIQRTSIADPRSFSPILGGDNSISRYSPPLQPPRNLENIDLNLGGNDNFDNASLDSRFSNYERRRRSTQPSKTNRSPRPLKSSLKRQKFNDGVSHISSFIGASGGIDEDDDSDNDNDNGGSGSGSESDNNLFVKPKRREPLEVTSGRPRVFYMDVDKVPDIDYVASGVDIDNRVLRQELEFSETESEDESDVGSVIEMLDDEGEPNLLQQPNTSATDFEPPSISPDDSGSSSEGSEYGALTASESEYNDSDVDIDIQVNEARQNRPKRHRIPTVKFWQNERVVYETDQKGLMTAVDVKRVNIPEKRYRQRRPYKRRNPLVRFEDEMNTNEAREVNAHIYDMETGGWREKTVATSIANFKFSEFVDLDGNKVPLVHQHIVLKDTNGSAVKVYLLRVEPGGIVKFRSEENRAFAFVNWQGKIDVSMNSNSEFSLEMGMACLVPQGNDTVLQNDGSRTSDSYLYFTEVDAVKYPELADALTRDTNSMLASAANMFQLVRPRGSMEDENGENREPVGSGAGEGEDTDERQRREQEEYELMAERERQFDMGPDMDLPSPEPIARSPQNDPLPMPSPEPRRASPPLPIDFDRMSTNSGFTTSFNRFMRDSDHENDEPEPAADLHSDDSNSLMKFLEEEPTKINQSTTSFDPEIERIRQEAARVFGNS